MDKKKTLQQYGRVLEQVDLVSYNTMKIHCIADYMVLPDNCNDLKECITFLKENEILFLILGNGSNVILSSKPFHGVVVSTKEMCAIEIYPGIGKCFAEAGAMMPKLAMSSIKNGLKGLEWAASLPGTVGGSVYGNAGCYNSCCQDVLESIRILDEKGDIKEIAATDLEMSYRHSILKEHKDWIILTATFLLEKGNEKESMELIQDRKMRRLATQPLEYPSAGSVFRNPEDVPAGKLIEECGLKNTRIHDAVVSEKHANFIINVGNATGEDVLALMKKVHDTVLEKTGYDLHREQEYIEWE